MKFEQCHFRKRKTTPVHLTNRVCAYSTIFEELVEFIKNYLELPIPDFSFIDRDRQQKRDSSKQHYSNLEIDEAAKACRSRWKLGFDTPLKNIVRILENAGVVITTFSGVSEKVDALLLNRKHPIIIGMKRHWFDNNGKKSIII